MIYIAKDYEGKPRSIVSCKTVEQAKAYWQGLGINVHTVQEFDISETRENEESGYVTPLLKTEEVDSYEFKHLSDRSLVLVSQ